MRACFDVRVLAKSIFGACNILFLTGDAGKALDILFTFVSIFFAPFDFSSPSTVSALFSFGFIPLIKLVLKPIPKGVSVIRFFSCFQNKGQKMLALSESCKLPDTGCAVADELLLLRSTFRHYPGKRRFLNEGTASHTAALQIFLFGKLSRKKGGKLRKPTFILSVGAGEEALVLFRRKLFSNI
mgnify:CR=1 FL=1